jgi:hypothetical protein
MTAPIMAVPMAASVTSSTIPALRSPAVLRAAKPTAETRTKAIRLRIEKRRMVGSGLESFDVGDGAFASSVLIEKVWR